MLQCWVSFLFFCYQIVQETVLHLFLQNQRSSFIFLLQKLTQLWSTRLSSSFFYLHTHTHIYTHMCECMYVCMCPTLSPPCFLCFSFLTNLLSLDHPSAFLDRRRYYEAYVRYVVFLGWFQCYCMPQQELKAHICLF